MILTVGIILHTWEDQNSNKEKKRLSYKWDQWNLQRTFIAHLQISFTCIS